MKIVFIADGHLKGPDDPNLESLVGFLDNLDRIDTLVVLGDLFDFWTGSNDVAFNNYRPVLDSLLKLRRKGIKIMYLEGNHDFTMGGFFTGDLGAEVYPDSTERTFDGKRFYLSHGDTIHMSPGNRLWRSFLRTSLFRFISRLAGAKVVWKIAMMLSNKSRRYNKGSEVLEGLFREFAKKKIGGGADGVILGHSHSPGVHYVEAGGKKGIYANPGSWAGQKSYLLYKDGKFEVARWGG